MNPESTVRNHQSLPTVVGIFVFALSFALFQMVKLEHNKSFQERLTVASKISSDKIMDKITFYSDVVFHKSKDWENIERLTESEWSVDTVFHIKHCIGLQTFIWMDSSFNPVWIAPREGHADISKVDFSLIANKVAETEKESWSLSEDGKTIWVFAPTFQRKNFIGYTFGSINIQRTLDHVLGDQKASDVRLALFADNKKVYSNGDIGGKDEEKWVQEQIIPSHGILWKLKIWPTNKLLAEQFGNHMEFAVLLFGLLSAVFAAILLRLLQNKSLYLQELDNANVILEKEISERVRISEEMRKLSRAAEQSPSSIIITDTAGNIEYVNPKFTLLSGYTLEEVVGKNPRILRSGKTSDEEYQGLWETITSGESWRGEFQNKKKNGDCYWGMASISPIKDPRGKITHFISSMEDITERKRAEEKLKNSLLEKEVLMREISHRAKNNMQVISSMIKMQSRDSGEPRFVRLLQDLGNRIAAMSIVYDQILQSNDLSRIDTRHYIASLTRNILSSYGENNGGRIELNAHACDISLDVETSVHCGLIINELVSNSLKHAFAPGQKGVIDVVFRHAEDGNFELVIHDNGVGLREDIDISSAKSLGMRLVTTLAENQLHGKIKVSRNHGTEFKIVFPAG